MIDAEMRTEPAEETQEANQSAPMTAEEQIALTRELMGEAVKEPKGEIPEEKEEVEEKASEESGDAEAEKVVEPSDDSDEWNIDILAGEVGLTAKEIYATAVKFGDGTDLEPQTLGQLKDFYAANHDAAKVLQERVKALDTLGTDMQAAQLAYQQHEPEIKASQERMDQLTQMWNSTDWDKLPEDQAKQYAEQLQSGYKMAELTRDNAKAMMTQTETQLEQVKAAEMQARQDAWQAHAAEEWPLILADNPTWKDEETAGSGMKSLYGLLGDYGMTPEEAHAVTDHRIFRALRDAHAHLNASAVTKKQVRKVTKVAKGGKPVPKSVLQKRAQQRKFAAAKGGDEAAKISLVSDLISS